MRHFINYAIAAAAACIFLSCDEEARLASELDGSWSGVPVTISNDISGLVTGVDTYLFSKTDSKQGTVDIATMISVSNALPEDSALVQPYSHTISAKAVATGTWMVTDDDEVNIAVDPASIVVTVDPDAIDFDTSLLTGNEAPVVDSMNAKQVSIVCAQIRKEMVNYYSSMSKLDDVRIKSDKLVYEIGKTKYVMSRQIDSAD